MAAPAMAQYVPATKDSNSAASGRTMFRNFIFGVTKQDVRKYESAPFYKEEGDSLFFLYQPDYFRRMVRYDFVDNKLIRMTHDVEELVLPNPYRILEMSQDTQAGLTKLYGDPARQEFFWKDKQYEKVPEAWGRALYSRDLQIQISWDLPDATLVQQTYYDGNQYQIRYVFEQKGAVKEDAPHNAIDLGTGQNKGLSTQTQP
jgi:hypothetical protein